MCRNRACSLRNTEPALTKSDLIAELAASNPHLRVADVELKFSRMPGAMRKLRQKPKGIRQPAGCPSGGSRGQN